MPFEFFPMPDVPEVILVRPRRFTDQRGFFQETYKRSDFRAAGITAEFVQDNHSLSGRGTVRGLHYQLPPYGQGKLVCVTAGAVWDVAVDIRRSSPTFRRWVAAGLDGEAGDMLWIPPGFAHGFLTLQEHTHLNYKCTAEYDGTAERGIRWDDPDLAIPWPFPADTEEYLTRLLSPRDEALPAFSDAELFP